MNSKLRKLLDSEKRSEAITDLGELGIHCQVYCHLTGDGESFWAHEQPEAYQELTGKEPPLRSGEIVGEVEAKPVRKRKKASE